MPSSRRDDRPVLVLGAGVNGISVARELLLNGLGVTVVDTADLAFGATSKSSRLIHGGLRYLEYGDFALVRESLLERERLLRAAPQFVTPLRLFIPVRQRLGGLLASGLRFAGLQRWPGLGQIATWSGSGPRGLVTVESGLRFYDFLAGETSLPHRDTVRVGSGGPAVDPARFTWLCSYSDCQMLYPERYVVALIRDCRAITRETGIPFELLTYHRATRRGNRVEIAPAGVDGSATGATAGEAVRVIEPVCIVNASGAWGDLTLGDLPVPSQRLLGGTKGSHIVTSQNRLREALRGDAVYAEAADGRLVFILPYGDAVMIGTTDDRFEGRPEDVYATTKDVDYLVGMVNEVFPQVALTAQDVQSHCCGVRPLPYVPQGATTAIPRGHWIASTSVDGLPVHTLVGGKLTTCRALGEETARMIVESRRSTARDGASETLFVSRTSQRPVPGSEGFPDSPAGLASLHESLARETGWTVETVRATVELTGTLAAAALQLPDGGDRRLLDGTPYPRHLARWMIDNEECRTLGDLVERRLMLALDPRTTRRTIEELAEVWREARGSVDLAPVLERLRRLYGRTWA